MLKKFTKLLSLVVVLTIASIVFGTHKVHAASITTGGGCTLSSAIDSVNGASDSGGCTSTGSYGINDTINLPVGTTTLSADLPAMTAPLKVAGAGKTTSTIDANGHLGFNGDFSSLNTSLFDYSFQDFTITGADYAAFILRQPKSTTMTNIGVNNSTSGALISGITITVTNSSFINNTSSFDLSSVWLGASGSSAGLSIMAIPLTNSDIPTVTVTDSTINTNSGDHSGLNIAEVVNLGAGDVSLLRTTIQRTSVLNNNGTHMAGLGIFEQGGPTASAGIELTVDSVTVANNTATATIADPLIGGIFNADPYIAGMNVTGNLTSHQNFTNLTATNNAVINTLDDQPSISGLEAVLNAEGSSLSIINATITNNTVTQTQPGPLYLSAIIAGNNVAFYALKIDFQNFIISPGATSQNSIIAGNNRNNALGSCATMDLSVFGLTGTADLTPTNLGNNITDDSNCTGYSLQPNILSTLGPLQDNGGPVPTIALLPGSPAISAGGQVLGISTDARGIARPSTPDVGAYQTVLGQSTTSNPSGLSGVAVPNSGFGGLANNPLDKNDLITPMFIIINFLSFAVGCLTIRKIKQYAE